MSTKAAKGISPLVATVLLIAVTMTIAGVLAVFAQNLVSDNLKRAANQPISSECQFANFQIDACSFNAGTGTATTILDNIGTVALSNITGFAIYPDNTVNFVNINGSLPSGALRSFQMTGLASNFTKIQFRTQCPQVSQESTCR